MKVKFVLILILGIFILSNGVFAENFSSVWSVGSDGFLTLPIESTGSYNFLVNWGDGNSGNVTSFTDLDRKHTYSSAGDKTVIISGVLNGFSFSNSPYNTNAPNLKRITSWGPVRLGNSGGYFKGTTNLESLPSDDAGISGTTNFHEIFRDASGLNTNNLNSWDVSSVTNMREAFRSATSFNGNLSGWDVSSVTNMEAMFRNNKIFNANITNWDVSSVTNMRDMFHSAWSFNQDISRWDVGNVTDMSGMFYNIRDFNQDLSKWRVCQVTNYNEFDQLAHSNWVKSRPKWGAPCTRSVTSNNTDGNYSAGDVIYINVTFNENVSVSGTPKLELKFDEENKNASYFSGNGTKSLIFAYNIVEGDSSSDLDYNGIYALNGSIKAVDDNKTAVLTLPSKDTLKANKNIFVGGVDEVFISTWNTSATSSGSSNNNQIKLPLENGGDYNFTVYWGDGTSSKVTAWNSANKTHTYGTAGIYTINITGKLRGFRFSGAGDKLKLINITSWGGLNLGNNGSYFYGAANLTTIVGEVNLSGVSDMSEMFKDAAKFNGDVSGWDVSSVTDMSGMFRGATAFNQSLNDWDVSSVTDMSGMFFAAYKFDGDISNWDVSSVTDMFGMFYNARAFNQDIGDWDVSSVLNMGGMFNSARDFNQDIGDWDVSSVLNMDGIFATATAFNRDLSGWQVCHVLTHDSFDSGASVWVDSNKPRLGAPCVVSVDFVNDDGIYSVGEEIGVVIVFDVNVSVSGVPVLELEFDGVNKDATYSSGDGTTNLTFSYVVQDGDVSDDLDYAGVDALKLGGASISASDDGKVAILGLFEEGLAMGRAVAVTDFVFTSTWEGSSVTLPLEDGGDYNFTVYWGDGNVSEVTAWDSTNKTHTYGGDGVYVVKVVGKLNGFRFNNGGDRLKLVNITRWGGLLLGNNGSYFYGAANLTTIVGEVNLSGVTDMGGMFYGASSFNGDVSGWDVSGVVDMGGMFNGATAFNGNIIGWNISSVIDMGDMFNSATAFNQDLSGWSVCYVLSYANFDVGASAWADSSKPKLGHPCVVGVGSSSVDGDYALGDVVSVRIDFSEDVVVSGVPKLELEFDGANRNADYVSGSGTRNLTFNYTVQRGDSSDDLDYTGENSLKFDGGNIMAVDDNKVVVLSLPLDRTLADIRDIVVDGVVPVVEFVKPNKDVYKTTDRTPSVVFDLVDNRGGDLDYVIYLDDVVVGNDSVDSGSEVSFDFGTMSYGKHIVRVDVEDGVGNVGSDNVTIDVRKKSSKGSVNVSEVVRMAKTFYKVVPDFPLRFAVDLGISIRLVFVDVVSELSNVKVVIEKSEKPIASPEHSGKALYYFNISVSGLSSADVESAYLLFDVSKDWLESNGLVRDDVGLLIFENGVWRDLAVVFVNESETDYLFRADVDEFSVFVVVGVGDDGDDKIVDLGDDGSDGSDGDGSPFEPVPKPEGGSKTLLWVLLVVGVVVAVGVFLIVRNWEKVKKLVSSESRVSKLKDSVKKTSASGKK